MVQREQENSTAQKVSYMKECFSLLHYFTKGKLYTICCFLLGEEPASKKVCSDDEKCTKESEYM